MLPSLGGGMSLNYADQLCVTPETDLLVQRLNQEMFTLDHLLYLDNAIMDVVFLESIHCTSHQTRVVLVF
jgi:hypothetical protein